MSLQSGRQGSRMFRPRTSLRYPNKRLHRAASSIHQARLPIRWTPKSLTCLPRPPRAIMPVSCRHHHRHMPPLCPRHLCSPLSSLPAPVRLYPALYPYTACFRSSAALSARSPVCGPTALLSLTSSRNVPTALSTRVSGLPWPSGNEGPGFCGQISCCMGKSTDRDT